MCCSARTATIVFSIWGIIGGISSLIFPFYSSWLLTIASILSIALSSFGCYAVFHNKYTWIRIYAYANVFGLVATCSRIVILLINSSATKNLVVSECVKLTIAKYNNITGKMTDEIRDEILKRCSADAQGIFISMIIFLIAICAFTLWVILAAFSAARTIKRSQNSQTVIGFNKA